MKRLFSGNDNEVSGLIALVAVFSIALGCNCGKGLDAGNSSHSQSSLFPPGEVCNYPSNSSIPKFRALGGGSWRYLKVGSSDLGYDCGSAEKQVFLNPSGDAVVEYGVVGISDGATSVGLDYSIQAPLANEIEFRKEFVVLLDELTTQALKENLPESVRTNILNLNTFSDTGTTNEESIPVGSGQLKFSRNRNRDNSVILVKVTIYADNANSSSSSRDNPFSNSTDPTTNTKANTGESKPDATTGSLPTDTELQFLVRETLLSFNDSIQKADFEAFYNSLSKPWKSQTTPDKLKTQFSSFIDGKASLGEIRT